MDTFDEFCCKLEDKIEPEDLVEVIGLTVAQNIERFDDLIVLNREALEDYLND